MSRKLYLDDAQVKAGQTALGPLKGTAGADLDRFIEAIMGLRSSTPKRWCYRVVDANGNTPDISYQSPLWDKVTYQTFGGKQESRNADTINGVHVPKYARSIKEEKHLADALSAALGVTHLVERRELIESRPNTQYGPWTVFYVGKPEKA